MAIDLSALFGQKPEAAIRFFKSKGYAFSWDWHDVREATHAKAFTVAKVTQLEVLQDIRAQLQSALDNGTTFASFKKDVRARLAERGWLAREVINEQTGELKTVRLGASRRLETIYRANLQSSYMAGRYEAMLANSKNRPYWLYVAINDHRTRPGHLALNGRVFRADDPIWNTIYPPNDWGCRCRVRALSEKAVRQYGYQVLDSADYAEHWIDQDRHGNEFTRTTIKTPTMAQPFATGRGWNSNPAKDAHTAMSTWALEKAVNSYPLDAASTFGTIFGRATVMQALADAYGRWFDQIDRTRLRGERYLVGVLPQEVVVALAERGITPESAVISVTDHQIGHALRDVKPNKLAVDVWRNLPNELQNSAVLHEVGTNELMFVSDAPDGKQKIVVTVNYKVRERTGGNSDKKRSKTDGQTNLVKTGNVIRDAATLRDSKRYEVLRGSI